MSGSVKRSRTALKLSLCNVSGYLKIWTLAAASNLLFIITSARLLFLENSIPSLVVIPLRRLQGSILGGVDLNTFSVVCF